MNEHIESHLREEILAHLNSNNPLPAGETLELLTRLSEQVDLAPDAGPQTYPAWFLLEELPENAMSLLLAPPPGSASTLDYEDFLPPEYLKKGGLDERGTVFALGITGFKLVTGNETPYSWSGSVVASMRTWMEGIVRPISELQPNCPGEFAAVIEKAVTRDPRERQQTVASFLNDLYGLHQKMRCAA